MVAVLVAVMFGSIVSPELHRLISGVGVSAGAPDGRARQYIFTNLHPSPSLQVAHPHARMIARVSLLACQRPPV